MNHWDQMQKVLRYPSFLDTLNRYEIEVLLDYVRRTKDEAERQRSLILLHNPQLGSSFKGSNYLIDSTKAETIISRYLENKGFKKSKEQQQKSGKKGGETKGQNNYKKFCEFVKASGFDVKSYAHVSKINFQTALNAAGFKCSENTADGYRREFLKETSK